MKKIKKIFIVLFATLSPLLSYADMRETNITSTVKKIQGQSLYNGASISFDREISGDNRIREAAQTFKDTCLKITGALKPSVSSAGSNEKTIKNTCTFEGCDQTKGYTLSKDKKTCVHTTYKDKESCVDTVKDKYAKTAFWDEASKTCKIETCVTQPEEYVLQDNKCVKKSNVDKKENKEKSALEKNYNKDIDALIEAYNTVVKKYVSQCKAKGGSIKNKECTVK